jgi:hypothetical protein
VSEVAETAVATDRAELFREATVMVLYVAVVEIGELAALPERHGSGDHVSGPLGGALLAIIWGTVVGLALAHCFAFQLAAPAFRGDRPRRGDWKISAAQLTGATFVALLSSLPVLLFSGAREQETVADVPAVLVGVVGYLVARRARLPRLAAAFFGITALVLGILVALIKMRLAAH